MTAVSPPPTPRPRLSLFPSLPIFFAPLRLSLSVCVSVCLWPFPSLPIFPARFSLCLCLSHPYFALSYSSALQINACGNRGSETTNEKVHRSKIATTHKTPPPPHPIPTPKAGREYFNPQYLGLSVDDGGRGVMNAGVLSPASVSSGGCGLLGPSLIFPLRAPSAK